MPQGFALNMARFLPVLFAVTGALSAKPKECAVDNLRCCVAPFLKFVSPAGLQLTARNVADVCTLEDEILDCTEGFEAQCSAYDKNLHGTINQTNQFIEKLCPWNSDFMKELRANEECFMSASKNFQACYSRSVLPQKDETWKVDCCEYKNVRNCAIQTVESACGPTAAQLLQEEIVAIQGLGLEFICEPLFGDCGNLASNLSPYIGITTLLFSVLFLMAL